MPGLLSPDPEKRKKPLICKMCNIHIFVLSHIHNFNSGNLL